MVVSDQGALDASSHAICAAKPAARTLPHHFADVSYTTTRRGQDLVSDFYR